MTRHPFYRWLRAILFAVLSPFVEKNPAKAFAADAPLVFSMSRCIVALFALGMYRQIANAGIAGWPESTLCIALVYALPVLSALDKVRPEAVLDFGAKIIDRFGVGDVRRIGNLYASDPETLVDREHEAVGQDPHG